MSNISSGIKLAISNAKIRLQLTENPFERMTIRNIIIDLEGIQERWDTQMRGSSPRWTGDADVNKIGFASNRR